MRRLRGTGAERLVSLLAAGTAMTRPAAIRQEHHLFLSLHDIAEPREGMTPPGEAHVADAARLRRASGTGRGRW